MYDSRTHQGGGFRIDADILGKREYHACPVPAVAFSDRELTVFQQQVSFTWIVGVGNAFGIVFVFAPLQAIDVFEKFQASGPLITKVAVVAAG